MSISSYLDCELDITAEDQGRLSVAGRHHTGRPALGAELRQRLMAAALEPERYGTLLFQALGEDLIAGYREGLTLARNDAKGLRLRLHVAPAAASELHELNWELLLDPKTGIALGRSRETVFSRYLSLSRKPGTAVVERPRMLVVLSCPSDVAEYDLAELDGQSLRGAIVEALRALGDQVSCEVLDGPATVSRIRDALVEDTFHMVHLLAHGAVKAGDAIAHLVLEDENRRAHFVSEAVLGETFEGHRELRLMTLIACHGGRTTGTDPFSGLGPALVRRGIPAVVAMRREIATEVAIRFTEHLYRNLARSPEIDRAVNEARQQLYLVDPELSDWGTPALFMRLDEGRLWAPVVEPVLCADVPPESGTFLRTVVACDSAAAEHRDPMVRDLLEEYGGREAATESVPVWLFERPWSAVQFSLSLQQALADLYPAPRMAGHLGEVSVRGRASEGRGSELPIAEGAAVAMARRLTELARPRQTLWTRHAFDLARQSAMGTTSEADIRWLAHGSFLVQDLSEAVEVFEVGIQSVAPLEPPEGSDEMPAIYGDDTIPGWRPAPGLVIPQRPHWQVERKIGEGGFGEVWLGRHPRTGERRVFKFCYEASRLRMLQREITLFRLLKEELGERDDIARILEWSFDEAPYFIEGEYTAGGDLIAWCEEQGGLQKVPLEVRLEIVAQVATALGAAHSVGVLHKDVKPGNVLVVRAEEGDVRVRLSDFGIGRITDRDRLAAAGITMAGWTGRTTEGDPSSSGGTRLYLAPEVLEGKPATIQADIYALGVMLYQLVVEDFGRALAPGWERDVDDELLGEDIACFVDGSPDHRPAGAIEVAERLRKLEVRRAQRAAERREREEAETARRNLERAQGRRRLYAAVAAVAAGMLVVVSVLAAWALINKAEAEANALRAEELRVGIAGGWMDRDPTTAALVLLEVKRPDETATAGVKMRQVLWHKLADEELRGHRNRLRAALFSPDGTRIVTASEDGTARVWSLNVPAEPIVLYGGDRYLISASFSPDGMRVVTASGDGTARVWSLDTSGDPLVLQGHTKRLWMASFSPDGTRVVTASDDGTARVWSLDVPANPLVLQHGVRVRAASFSHDGTRVVTAAYDGTARIWSLNAPTDPVVLQGHNERLYTALFNPDDSQVVTASGDGTARVWTLDDPGDPLVLEGHESAVYMASFSPDSAQVVTASADGTARVWSLHAPTNPLVLQLNPQELRVRTGIQAASFSPDGTRVLTAGYEDGTARVWSLKTPGDPLVLQGHRFLAIRASFSPDGTRVVTASFDGTARVWAIDELTDPLVLRHDHAASVYSASFSPDGTRVVTASRDSTALVWSLAQPGDPVVLAGHASDVITASFSPSGSSVVTASADSTARVWSLDNKPADPLVLHHDATVRAASFSPNGKQVVTASDDGTARVWLVHAHADPLVLQHEDRVHAASFSPNGARVVTASFDGTARVWFIDAPTDPLVLQHQGRVRAAKFSPNGLRVLTASEDGAARVWSIGAQADPLVLQHDGAVYDASFSPDGTRVVTVSRDNTVRVWLVDAPADPLVLPHGSSVSGATFSPDGTRVVTASGDGTARVWSFDAPNVPLVLEGHGGGIFESSFSPDGMRVVTASEDGTARVWLLSTGDLRGAIRVATRVCLTPEFRQKSLGEKPERARRNFEECERSHGRTPQL